MERHNFKPSSTQVEYKHYRNASFHKPNSTGFSHLDSVQDYQTPSIISSPSNSEFVYELPGYILKTLIECDLSYNEDGSVLIDCPSLQIYSTGESRVEAIVNLKDNIIDLYEDLKESDNFSADWLSIKTFLQNNIQEK